MRTLTLPLHIIEPSEPSAGAILIADQDNNDIAEFYHSECATVGQSYAEALSLAGLTAAAPGMAEALRSLSDALRSGQFSVKGALSMIDAALPKACSRNVSRNVAGTDFPADGNSFPENGNKSATSAAELGHVA